MKRIVASRYLKEVSVAMKGRGISSNEGYGGLEMS